MSTTGPSVIHTMYNRPPTVTEGELTPKIVMEFEQACRTFFNNVKGRIPKEQKVARILPAFRDTLICDWIASSRNNLIRLTFDGFLEELWRKQLPHKTQILSERLRGDSRFSTWAMQIQSLNCLLRGSASHFNESYMCEQLEARIDKELCILGHEAKVHNTESIRDFLEIYELCDAKRKITQKAI